VIFYRTQGKSPITIYVRPDDPQHLYFTQEDPTLKLNVEQVRILDAAMEEYMKQTA
jgi:hypothetical protein